MTVMEIKKNSTVQRDSSLASGENAFKKVLQFFSDLKAEIFKINWTTKEELQVYTRIIVIALFTCGMSIYAVDLIIQGVLNFISTIMRFLIG
jgi:preprotein translocase subunit SecE